VAGDSADARCADSRTAGADASRRADSGGAASAGAGSWAGGATVASPDAALLGQFPRLAVDRLHPADRVRARVGVAEQTGQLSGPGLLEPLGRVGVGAGQIEGAGPAVLVIQQRVPAAEVGQRVDPLPLRGGGEFYASVVSVVSFGSVNSGPSPGTSLRLPAHERHKPFIPNGPSHAATLATWPRAAIPKHRQTPRAPGRQRAR